MNCCQNSYVSNPPDLKTSWALTFLILCEGIDFVHLCGESGVQAKVRSSINSLSNLLLRLSSELVLVTTIA